MMKRINSDNLVSCSSGSGSRKRRKTLNQNEDGEDIGGGGGDDLNGSCKNPLDIQEILCKIVNLVTDFEDLKRIRYVKNSWREACIENWRKSATLTVTSEVIDRFYEEEHKKQQKSSVKLLTEEYIRFRFAGRPFKNCRITIPIFTTSPNRDPVKEMYFWTNLGPHMKVLDLEKCFFKSNEALEKLKLILLKYFGNLEELKMMPYLSEERSIAPNEPGHEVIRDMENELNEAGEVEENGRDRKVVPAAPSIAGKLHTLTILSTSTCHTELFQDEQLALKFMHSIPNLKNLTVVAGHSICPILKALYTSNSNTIAYIKLDKLAIILPKEMAVMVTDFYFFYIRLYVLLAKPEMKSLRLQARYPSGTMELWHLASTFKGIRGSIEDVELNLFRTGNVYEIGNESVELFRLTERYAPFPVLSRLSIQIDYSLSDNPKIVCFDLSRLFGLWNLKYFCFECKGAEGCDRFISQRVVKEIEITGGHPFSDLYLKNLEEFHYCGSLEDSALDIVLHWVRNVKCFEAILDSASLLKVLARLPKLEKVTVHRWSRREDFTLKSINEMQKEFPKVTFILPWIPISSN